VDNLHVIELAEHVVEYWSKKYRRMYMIQLPLAISWDRTCLVVITERRMIGHLDARSDSIDISSVIYVRSAFSFKIKCHTWYSKGLMTAYFIALIIDCSIQSTTYPKKYLKLLVHDRNFWLTYTLVGCSVTIEILGTINRLEQVLLHDDTE
jgi:hypothetical protein